MSDQVKPITPAEVGAEKSKHIPNEIIAAANELIARTWDGAAAEFSLRDLEELAIKKLGKNYQFKEGDLDIEIPFTRAGWKVTFDKPGYNETYNATFTFTKGRKRR